MPQKNTKASRNRRDEEQVEEFRRLLQTDDIAPVDIPSYGKRLAEIIQRATMRNPGKRGRDKD